MDEYVVRLGRAPSVSGDVDPRPVTQHRSFPVRVAVLAVLAILAAANQSTVKGWVGSVWGGAKSSVNALQAEEQLRTATNVLEQQWDRDQTYDVSTARLASLDGAVAWGEVVAYEVCFHGTGAVASADTTAGPRSALVIRGSDYGFADGRPGCPSSPADHNPWGDG